MTWPWRFLRIWTVTLAKILYLLNTFILSDYITAFYHCSWSAYHHTFSINFSEDTFFFVWGQSTAERKFCTTIICLFFFLFFKKNFFWSLSFADLTCFVPLLLYQHDSFTFVHTHTLCLYIFSMISFVWRSEWTSSWFSTTTTTIFSIVVWLCLMI